MLTKSKSKMESKEALLNLKKALRELQRRVDKLERENFLLDDRVEDVECHLECVDDTLYRGDGKSECSSDLDTLGEAAAASAGSKRPAESQLAGASRLPAPPCLRKEMAVYRLRELLQDPWHITNGSTEKGYFTYWVIQKLCFERDTLVSYDVKRLADLYNTKATLRWEALYGKAPELVWDEDSYKFGNCWDKISTEQHFVREADVLKFVRCLGALEPHQLTPTGRELLKDLCA